MIKPTSFFSVNPKFYLAGLTQKRLLPEGLPPDTEVWRDSASGMSVVRFSEAAIKSMIPARSMCSAQGFRYFVNDGVNGFLQARGSDNREVLLVGGKGLMYLSRGEDNSLGFTLSEYPSFMVNLARVSLEELPQSAYFFVLNFCNNKTISDLTEESFKNAAKQTYTFEAGESSSDSHTSFDVLRDISSINGVGSKYVIVYFQNTGRYQVRIGASNHIDMVDLRDPGTLLVAAGVIGYANSQDTIKLNGASGAFTTGNSEILGSMGHLVKLAPYYGLFVAQEIVAQLLRKKVDVDNNLKYMDPCV